MAAHIAAISRLSIARVSLPCGAAQGPLAPPAHAHFRLMLSDTRFSHAGRQLQCRAFTYEPAADYGIGDAGAGETGGRAGRRAGKSAGCGCDFLIRCADSGRSLPACTAVIEEVDFDPALANSISLIGTTGKRSVPRPARWSVLPPRPLHCLLPSPQR